MTETQMTPATVVKKPTVRVFNVTAAELIASKRNGELIEIIRYPNRRLYVRARPAGYIVHREITRLVRGGKTVVVTDKTTTKDITSAILLKCIDEDSSISGQLSVEKLMKIIKTGGL